MHERLEALKPLLKAGDYDKAAEALKSYREEFPDDWDGKLMEGIVAKLRSDEETFHRIHDEAQAVIDGHGQNAAQIKASPLWKKYHSTWEKIAKVAVTGLKISAIGGLVAAGAGTAMLNRNVNLRLKWMFDVIRDGLPEANRRLEHTRKFYDDLPYKYDAPLYDAPKDDRFD